MTLGIRAAMVENISDYCEEKIYFDFRKKKFILDFNNEEKISDIVEITSSYGEKYHEFWKVGEDQYLPYEYLEEDAYARDIFLQELEKKFEISFDKSKLLRFDIPKSKYEKILKKLKQSTVLDFSNLFEFEIN